MLSGSDYFCAWPTDIAFYFEEVLGWGGVEGTGRKEVRDSCMSDNWIGIDTDTAFQRSGFFFVCVCDVQFRLCQVTFLIK